MKSLKIDSPVFLSSACVLMLLSASIWLWGGQVDVAALKNAITEKVGSAFLFIGILSLVYVIFIAFSRIGDILLTGKPDETVQLTTMQWIARLFAGGIGASILFWAATEWIFYLQTPPFMHESSSKEAIEWASTYGMFHWGPIAWAMYLVPTIPIAYVYHVRKVPILKLSSALAPAIGEARAQGWLGKSVDICFIIGVVAGGATGLGVKGPLIAEGAGWLLGFAPTIESAILAIMFCALLFLVLFIWNPAKSTSYLASGAFYGTFIIFAIFLAFGPANFMLSHGLESVGRILDNFFTMATYSQATDAQMGISPNHFPQNWTVFYWSWWLVFAPAMGLYLAKISQGRTIRQVILGAIFFGSLGAFAFFSIIGNFGLSLFLNHTVELPTILAETRPAAAVLAMLEELPLPWIVVILYIGVVVFYTSAGLESFSFMLGAVSQKNLESGVHFPVRIFWSVLLITLASLMIFIGGIDILQVVTIVCAVPMLVVMHPVAWAGWRIAWSDLRYHNPEETNTIALEKFPEVDPWSKEGKALARFKTLCAEASELAQIEKGVIDEIANRNRQISLETCSEEEAETVQGELTGLQAEYAELRKRRALLKLEIDALYEDYQILKAQREDREAQEEREEIKEAYMQHLEEQNPIKNKELQEKIAELKADLIISSKKEEAAKKIADEVKRDDDAKDEDVDPSSSELKPTEVKTMTGNK